MEILTLEEIINEQKESFGQKDPGTKRAIDFEKHLRTKQIVVISGVRRSGKSTLLRQFSLLLGAFHYLNFDDERLLDFTVKDFDRLILIWHKENAARTILFDEIQNVPQWERFVRRIHDEGYKVFLTGSNAKLLSGELATHLTGRYFKVELYPFSFREIVAMDGIATEKLTTAKRAKLLARFDRYLKEGGFPEYVKSHDEEYLKRIYEDVIYKDIITRFGIREVRQFRTLSNHLFANIGKEASYGKLAKTLEIKSPMSVRKHVGFLSESYLLFELPKHDYSLRKQAVANRKIYCIDNGLRNAVAFRFSDDDGRLLENSIFLELKRSGKEVFFFQGSGECDFLVWERGRALAAIQVSYVLNHENQQREIDGLVEAMDAFGLSVGTIITYNEDEEVQVGKKKISLVPAWKWMLGHR